MEINASNEAANYNSLQNKSSFEYEKIYNIMLLKEILNFLIVPDSIYNLTELNFTFYLKNWTSTEIEV